MTRALINKVLATCGIVALFSVSPVFADLNEDRDPAKDILLAIDRELATLPENSLTLPEAAEMPEPPPNVTEAGEDFVTAWRLYRTIAMRPPGSDTKQSPPDRETLINAHEEWKLFHDLITRTIEADTPPDPSEYARYTYSSLDWCGVSGSSFSRRHETGLILANIRHGNHLEALRMLSVYNRPSRDTLLRAFGADPEMFVIGEWLNKKCRADVICETGGEPTAVMLMRWIDLNFAQEQTFRKIEEETRRFGDRGAVPYFPNVEIRLLLRPDNGVTDETKRRIAQYIGTNGTQLIPVGRWIQRCPKGAEKWMAPIATRGLGDPLNVVRTASSRLLEAAGVTHAPPEMRPNPRFRVLLNGKPWTGQLGNLRLSIHSEEALYSASFVSMQDGIFTYDADDFRSNGELIHAQFTVSPFFTVSEPIKLPVDFDGVNTVNLIKRELKISPVFPRMHTAIEDRTYAIKICPLGKGQRLTGDGKWTPVKNHEPHTYWHVSPGDYMLGIRYPGGIWGPDMKITVNKDTRTLRPVIPKASSLVVPVNWPELAAPEKLPPELAIYFVRSRSDMHKSLRAVVGIKAHGAWKERENVPVPESAEGRFPNSVIFPYLPPGKYTIESPDRIIEPTGTNPGCVIKRSSIEVEIKEDSPVYVITEPLEIHYTRKD